MSLTPLVLLPGLLCDHRLFEPQTVELARLGPVAVADLTTADSIACMAGHVLAHAPPRFALAGLSMGGIVTLEILRQAPERVERVALIDTQARADDAAARERRLALIDLARSGGFSSVPQRLLPLLVHPDRVADVGLAATVRAMAEAVGRDAFIRQQTALMGRIDSRPSLPAIRCPTLVLAGRQDALTPPPVQEEMAAAIPDATLVILPRCGHLAPLERPDVVARLLRDWWLA